MVFTGQTETGWGGQIKPEKGGQTEMGSHGQTRAESEVKQTVFSNEGETFSLNKSFLDCLLKASRKYDYGILVATADDLSVIRKLIKKTPRDNIVFEMGLFLGSLGLTRAFLFSHNKCKLPTDYNGISYASFKSKKIDQREIEPIIKQLNSTKNTYSLKTIPSVALALGYFDNFISHFSKLRSTENFTLLIKIPNNLDDISTTISIYKENYPSEEICVYNDGSRPLINRLISDNSKYWDIPTTLTTLNKLINTMVHTVEIGKSPERQEWIEYELRNFKGTLETLIDKTSFCKGKVIVEWL